MNIERGKELKKSVGSSSQKIEEKLLMRKPWGEILKNKISQFTEAIGFSKSPKELEEKMKEEIGLYEKESIIEGVNLSRCQIDEIVDDYKNGKKVEFESFSPYLSDYNTATGEIWKDKLTGHDKIGLAVGKILRELFPKARVISLYDEYNSEMPDTTDSRGIPKAGPQIEFSEEAKNNFLKGIGQLLKDNSVINNDNKEGNQYLFISESSKIDDAKKLVEKLDNKGYIRRDGEAIYFINDKAENPKYKEIQLRTKSGRWLCEALDSSSYIKSENLDITHLVVLPNHFKGQQDKVWEILKVLGVESDRYHNIFFDEKADPEKVAEIIKKEFKKYF